MNNKTQQAKILKNENSNTLTLGKHDYVYTFYNDIDRDSLEKLYMDFTQLNVDRIENLYFVLCSRGGSPSSAFEMAYFLRNYADNIIGMIPSYAFSSSVILALSFDEIQFGTFGYFGPMDTQIPSYSAGIGFGFDSTENIEACYQAVIDYGLEAMDKAVKMILNKTELSPAEAISLSQGVLDSIVQPVLNKMEPKKIGDYFRSCELASTYGVRVLKDIQEMEIKDAWELCNCLTKGYPTHGFHIKENELKKLGLPIVTPHKDELRKLNNLCFFLENCPQFQGFSTVKNQYGILDEIPDNKG